MRPFQILFHQLKSLSGYSSLKFKSLEVIQNNRVTSIKKLA